MTWACRRETMLESSWIWHSGARPRTVASPSSVYGTAFPSCSSTNFGMAPLRQKFRENSSPDSTAARAQIASGARSGVGRSVVWQDETRSCCESRFGHPTLTTTSARPLICLPKIRLDVAAQHESAQVERRRLRPAAGDDEIGRQHLGQDAAVHAEFRQGELELVHVAVIADLLGLRHGLQPAAAIELDVSRSVRIPPMAVGHHVGKDPTVADQLLVARLASTEIGNVTLGKALNSLRY